MNLENETLRVLNHSISRYKKMEALAIDDGERQRIKANLKELRQMRDELLGDVENDI